MILFCGKIKIFRISPKLGTKIPNIVCSIVMQPDTALVKFFQKSFFTINPIVKILDSIISFDVSLPSGMNTAIGKKIATENIFVCFRTNTFPIVLYATTLSLESSKNSSALLVFITTGFLNNNLCHNILKGWFQSVCSHSTLVLSSCQGSFLELV